MLAGKHTTTGPEQAEDDHMTVTGCSYALLADGATAEIRPATPDDLDAVTRFHRDMSPDNLYLRFFSLSKRAAEQEARRVCRPADADHAALLALLGPRLAGLASYELTGTLTGTDADDLIRQIRAAPLLLGHRGQPAADLGALRDTLLRVSRLADDLPQVAELDLNPVIARPDGVFAVDARVRLTSHRAADPFLRQLRMPPGEQRPEKEGVPQWRPPSRP
jgi:hypothetical protein